MLFTIPFHSMKFSRFLVYSACFLMLGVSSHAEDDVSVPNAPTNLRAAKPFLSSYPTIEFAWEDNSDNEDLFRYELRLTEEGAAVFTQTTAKDATSQGITGPITYGDTFYFRVRAESTTLGDSEWTEQVMVVMPSTPLGMKAGDYITGHPGELFRYESVAYGNVPTGFTVEGLPAGLSLNAATGVISGRPTEMGFFRALVTVSDGVSTSSTFVVLRIAERTVEGGAGEYLTFTSPDLKIGIATYSATELPSELSLNPATGEITGTFGTAGNYRVLVTATGTTGTIEFPVNFAITEWDFVGDLGQTFQLEGLGIGESATFSATGLPLGLTINTTTGEITGRLGRAGNYVASVVISGAVRMVTVDIAFEILETVPFMTGGIVGLPLTAYVPAKYGTSPGNFSASGLPAGLVINATSGDITGTPTEPGIFVPTISMVGEGIPIDSHVTMRIVDGGQNPVVTASVANQEFGEGVNELQVDLSGHFADAETQSAVRISTNLGNLDVRLYEREAPATSANFLNYVNRGDYSDVVFHRSTRLVPSGLEIIQSGWFKPDGSGAYTSVTTDPSVQNEPGISNLRGTIAVAKLGGDPDSGTSQWYFNVSSSAAALDPPTNNGGFTVFGRLSTPSLAVMDDIHSRPIANFNVTLDGSVRNVSGWPTLAAPAGALPVQGEYIQISSAAKLDAVLNYTVTGNSVPGVADAAVSPTGQLILTRVADGMTDIEVTATDLDGNTVATSFTVVVGDILFGDLAFESEVERSQALLTLALGGFPGVPGSEAAMPVRETVNVAGDDYLALSFLHRRSTMGISYTVEYSEDLSSWSPVWTTADGFAHSQVVSGGNPNSDDFVTVRAPSPLGHGGSGNLRLRVDYLP